MQTQSIIHLVKSNDWLNDYEEQRLGEKILQSQIDNVNITLQNNNNNNNNNLSTLKLLTNKPFIICINMSHI